MQRFSFISAVVAGGVVLSAVTAEAETVSSANMRRSIGHARATILYPTRLSAVSEKVADKNNKVTAGGREIVFSGPKNLLFSVNISESQMSEKGDVVPILDSARSKVGAQLALNGKTGVARIKMNGTQGEFYSGQSEQKNSKNTAEMYLVQVSY